MASLSLREGRKAWSPDECRLTIFLGTGCATFCFALNIPEQAAIAIARMQQSTTPTTAITMMMMVASPRAFEEPPLSATISLAVGGDDIDGAGVVGRGVGGFVGRGVVGEGVGAGVGENVTVSTPVTVASARPRRRAQVRRRLLASATTAVVKEPSLTAALSSVFAHEKRVAWPAAV